MDPALNELIGAIYDATIEPGLWHDAIERIRQLYRFQIAILAINRLPDMSPLVQVACNVPAWYAEHVGEYTDAIPELWGGLATIARLPLEEPIVQSQVHDFRQHPDNRWYAEWSKPQGLVDQVVIGLANDPTLVASLGMGVHKPAADHHPGLDDLRILAPHLRRAATISNLIGTARLGGELPRRLRRHRRRRAARRCRPRHPPRQPRRQTIAARRRPDPRRGPAACTSCTTSCRAASTTPCRPPPA